MNFCWENILLLAGNFLALLSFNQKLAEFENMRTQTLNHGLLRKETELETETMSSKKCYRKKNRVKSEIKTVLYHTSLWNTVLHAD